MLKQLSPTSVCSISILTVLVKYEKLSQHISRYGAYLFNDVSTFISVIFSFVTVTNFQKGLFVFRLNYRVSAEIKG